MKDRLSDDVVPENETFEQQMQDLDVPVEKRSAKALTGWIKARNYGSNTVKNIRIGKTIISFSPKTTKLFKVGDDEYKFAVCIVDFEKKPALLLKPDKKGIKLKQFTGLAYQAAITRPMAEAFKKYGVKQGSYTINVVKDGYLAVLDG